MNKFIYLSIWILNNTSTLTQKEYRGTGRGRDSEIELNRISFGSHFDIFDSFDVFLLYYLVWLLFLLVHCSYLEC